MHVHVATQWTDHTSAFINSLDNLDNMSKCYMNYNIITNSIDYATVFVDFPRGLICVHVHSTKYNKNYACYSGNTVNELTIRR